MRLTRKENNYYIGSNEEWNELIKTKLVDLNYVFKLEQKLGQLEDIEDDLGIDLIILFKALKSKELYWKTNGYGIIKTTFQTKGLQADVSFIDDHWYISLVYQTLDDWELLSDYGKTWALTKEELK